MTDMIALTRNEASKILQALRTAEADHAGCLDDDASCAEGLGERLDHIMEQRLLDSDDFSLDDLGLVTAALSKATSLVANGATDRLSRRLSKVARLRLGMPS